MTSRHPGCRSLGRATDTWVDGRRQGFCIDCDTYFEPESTSGDFMGKKPMDILTAEAWNGLVELMLQLSMRVALLEQKLEEADADQR